MALGIVMSVAGTARAQPRWEVPRRGNCSGDGHREFSAIITGDYHGDWVDACKATANQINGSSYSARDCGWNGGRVWGKFDVRDGSCAVSDPETHFELPAHKKECQPNGTRHWSAIITGTHYTGDWVTACTQ